MLRSLPTRCDFVTIGDVTASQSSRIVRLSGVARGLTGHAKILRVTIGHMRRVLTSHTLRPRSKGMMCHRLRHTPSWPSLCRPPACIFCTPGGTSPAASPPPRWTAAPVAAAAARWPPPWAESSPLPSPPLSAPGSASTNTRAGQLRAWHAHQTAREGARPTMQTRQESILRSGCPNRPHRESAPDGLAPCVAPGRSPWR